MKTLITYLVKGMLGIALGIASITNAWAFKVDSRPQTITQPDGSTIEVLVSGDQYCHWLHDANNFTIVQDASGYFVYAELIDGKPSPSVYKVGTVDPSSVGLKPGLNFSAEFLNNFRKQKGAYDERPSYFGQILEKRKANGGKFGAAVMNPLVIFVRFSDDTEFPADKAVYNGIFNTDANSLKNYYLYNSYNQLTINSNILGGATSTAILSYKDANPRSYYLAKTATNPNGYDSGNQWARESALWINAINALKSNVPATLDVDGNDDGFIDEIYFVVRGSNDPTWASLLWPHAGGLPNTVTINGAKTGSFMCVFESWHDVGLLSHETGHVLGAPDFYRYSDNTIAPLSTWETMSNQTNPPQSMSAYTKLKYMGFINSIPEIKKSGFYTLTPIGTSQSAYKIPSTKAGEYYVVEYRLKTASSYESQIPGSGLVIYRVNSAAGGNGGGPPDELYVYRPGGTNTTTNGTISNAFFNSAVGRTQFTDATSPNGFMSDNTLGHLNITDIGAAGSTITFFYKAPFCMTTTTKTVTYTSTSTIPSVTEAIQYITNSGTVTIASGLNKTYRSETVYMEPGFKAASGCTFRATTPICTPSYQTIPAASRLLAQTQVAVDDNNYTVQDMGSTSDLDQLIEVYPNPAVDEISLKSNSINLGEISTLEIFDAKGAKIMSTSVTDLNAGMKINMSDKSPGIYYLRAKSGNETATKMFVIKNR